MLKRGKGRPRVLGKNAADWSIRLSEKMAGQIRRVANDPSPGSFPRAVRTLLDEALAARRK